MKGMSSSPVGQQGAALVVGLVLLMVLTILAVSGVFTSTMELRMTANTQLQERAFQAAEVGIEEALANPLISTSVPETQAFTPNPNSIDDEYSYDLRHICTTQPGIDVEGISIDSGFMAYHFQVEADGRAPGNARAEHMQNFYIIGPPSPPSEDCT